MNINFLTQATVVEEKSNTVDTVFVNRFINGMMRIPTEIRLRFKTINNIPAVTVTLTYKSRIKDTLTTIANGELISAMVTMLLKTLPRTSSWKCLKHSSTHNTN